MTKWFVGIPLQLLIIVAVSVAIIFICHRLINKGVERLIARAAVAEQQTPRRAVDTGELTDVLLGQRRRQRAEAIGALLRSAVTAFVVCCAVLMVLPCSASTSSRYWPAPVFSALRWVSGRRVL